MYKINYKTLSKDKSYNERYRYRAEYGNEIAGISSYYKIDKKLEDRVKKLLNENNENKE